MPKSPSSDRTPFDLLTESDWAKLSQPEREAVLKRNDDEVMRKHNQLLDGQRELGSRIDAQGVSIAHGAEATQDLSARVDVVVSSLGKLDEKTDLVVTVVEIIDKGFKGLAWLTKVGKDLALPLLLLYGGARALHDWAKSFGWLP